MQTIELKDLLNIVEYEKVRNDYRKEIIEYKKHRRVFLGDKISMVFENKKTMKFHIQEMMRAERMFRDEEVLQEIQVYSPLLPGNGELSATLFIEITEENRIREDLHQFLGLTDRESVFFAFGNHQIAAEFEAGRSEEDKISSVHYIRFKFSPAQITDFQNMSLPVAISIRHKGYDFDFPVSEAMRNSLIADIIGTEQS